MQRSSNQRLPGTPHTNAPWSLPSTWWDCERIPGPPETGPMSTAVAASPNQLSNNSPDCGRRDIADAWVRSTLRAWPDAMSPRAIDICIMNELQTASTFIARVRSLRPRLA